MSEDHQTRLKRLRMRMMRRGMKEMDLILISFGDAQLSQMDPAGLDRLEALLDENDQDIYSWITGFADAPDAHQVMLTEIQAHLAKK